MDSYQKFLKDFNIKKEEFIEWGINNTIWPSIDNVHNEWEDLKSRIFNNKTVYIRGYGRDAHGTKLYQKLYEFLFNNTSVKKDPSNNTAPRKMINKTIDHKKNTEISNYQISHIWGKTKNIFLFEAPWNICYVPKIIDPFTGHESVGELSIEYKKEFFNYAYQKYKSFIIEYNEILEKYTIEHRTEEFLNSLIQSLSEKELNQFSKNAKEELSPIRETLLF